MWILGERHWNGYLYRKELHLADRYTWYTCVTVYKHIILTNWPVLQIILCCWMWLSAMCHWLIFTPTWNCYYVFCVDTLFTFWKWSLAQMAAENIFRGALEKQSRQHTKGGILSTDPFLLPSCAMSTPETESKLLSRRKLIQCSDSVPWCM